MESFLRSVTEQFPTPIDCRNLVLELEFHSMTKKQTAELCMQFIDWCEQITGDGYVKKRHLDNRCVSYAKLIASMEERICAGHMWGFWQEAYVVNPLVYNAKTITEYQRHVRRILSTGEVPNLQCSLDYPAYWTELFPNGKEDPNSVCEKIIQLFREENRMHLGSQAQIDATTHMTVAPYHTDNTQFSGSAKLAFSAFSIGPRIQDLADKMRATLVHLSNTFVNINGRIKLAPQSECYGTYFGQQRQTDGSHEIRGLWPIEWYRSYYIPSVEWFNVLSPLAQSHLEGAKLTMQGLHTDRLSGGGLQIHVPKPIEQYSLSDARNVKQLLLPALCPAKSAIPLKMLFPDSTMPFIYHLNPRREWAIIPVFSDEVAIIGNHLVFSQRQPDESA